MTFAALLAQEIQIERYTGTTYTGDPSYNTAETINARVEGNIKRVFDGAGVERQSTAVIFTSDEISVGDRVTLSGTDSRVVLVVKEIPGASGSIHHYEAYV